MGEQHVKHADRPDEQRNIVNRHAKMACAFIFSTTFGTNSAFRTWDPPPFRINKKRPQSECNPQRSPLLKHKRIYEHAATCLRIAALEKPFFNFISRRRQEKSSQRIKRIYENATTCFQVIAYDSTLCSF
jgi:hypothetical protein